MQKYKVYINNKQKIITDNWELFCSKYNFIEASGGVVYNHDKQILMIYRHGKWDLPKGKIEIGESPESCAIREVEEECGVYNLNILGKLNNTYHTYSVDKIQFLKQTYWFRMKTDFSGELIPQKEEGIDRVCWVDKDEVTDKLKNSFENIKQLLNDEIC